VMATKMQAPTLPPTPDDGRPSWTTPLFVLLGVIILAVAATQLLGRASEKDVLSFSSANAAIGSIVPVLVAAVVAWLIPQGHGVRVRIPLAVMAGLFAIFIARMWPSAIAEPAEGAAAGEMPTLLSWLIGLPLAGAVAILFMPRQTPRLLKATTLIIMLGTLVASIPLLRVDMGKTFHFNHDVVWIERFGIHWHVALDGISLWLVVLTLFSTPIAAYVSFGSVTTRIKDWCFALLLLEGGMIGAFVALDLFMFYVFWELMLIPMYVMIGVWGGANRIKAALKFFLYTMAGSLLMLAAILYLAYTYGKITGGNASFDFFELQRLQLPRHLQIWLWAGFAISFFVKVPMWPVHTWLPDAHTEAPTAGSIILAAVMLKMGTYGYLRFCMGLFPESSGELASILGGVAVLGGILYGALCAWRQDDVKRLVAYSSVAHLGYVMLGLFAATQGAIEGSIIQMVNHGVSTGALFLLVGVIYDRRHTRMLDDFGGLAKVMPVYATLFVIATMASIGVPGLNGFVGEFMIITGTFASDKLGHVAGIQAVGAGLGVILAALYMLTAVQKMFFGPITRDENKRLPDINSREIIAVAPLVVAMFLLGFAPNILLSQMHGAVERVLTDYDFRAKSPTGGKYYDGPIRLGNRRPFSPAALTQSPAATAEAAPPPAQNEPPPGGAPGGRPSLPGAVPGGAMPPALRNLHPPPGH
ncbi:MAG TPA: NADH-quinone oxidoreductase subunit M, partial [Labilithrix sp.]|nr:NADH-quinone oxidoreductase subunit M [Labilithrix sp.]